MTLPVITGEFRVAMEPKLRFAPSGVAVAELRAVASSRKKDDSTGEWRDDKTAWVTIVCFKQLAENVAESIDKGALVTVVGKLNVEDWEDGEGNKRTSVKVVADFVGPSLAMATAKVTKTQGGGGSGGSPSSSGASRSSQQDHGDPWAAPSGGQAEEPPF